MENSRYCTAELVSWLVCCLLVGWFDTTVVVSGYVSAAQRQTRGVVLKARRRQEIVTHEIKTKRLREKEE